ncbi:alkaline phosphatase family protein [Sphingomonas sp. ID0503]|uniref:alkaline phosphatase family protein n=1 Tax=Sphingomonas sp. ID0503 TaxID=3399691 RepID=UPI003AFA74D5
MRKLVAVLIAGVAALAGPAFAKDNGQRLILVTLDGMRWQEVFRGPDPQLIEDKAFTDDEIRPLAKAAWMDVPDRAAALMPFVHKMAEAGVLYGEQDKGQCMRVANGMWFSYPGYNEILTGKPDDAIRSNDKVYNKNTTWLEWLNKRPGFQGKVAAVSMWDAFPYIINDKRSGVAVNAGIPGNKSPTDVLAVRQAIDAIRGPKPRVLYVAFGETDEVAHAGQYNQYLYAANRTDDQIRQIWEAAQADPDYRGRTTLIVTTDHGRGAAPNVNWTYHASAAAVVAANKPGTPEEIRKNGFAGSNEIWFAAMGPAVKQGAAPSGDCLTQGQVASSALTALGEDWKAYDPTIPAPLPPFAR